MVYYLMEHQTGKMIRRATYEEVVRSLAAAEDDGGQGIITVNIEGQNIDCYVR